MIVGTRINGIQIASEINPVAEAELQASHLSGPSAWTYGSGTGLLTHAALNRVEKVIVVETNREIASHFPRIQSPRVCHVSGAGMRQVHEPFAVSPVDVRFADPECHPLRDILTGLLNKDFNDRRFAVMLSDHQFQADRNRLRQDPLISVLAGANPHAAAVIGSGPTLADTIKHVSKHDLVVCASSALRALVKADIIPDFVVAIDPVQAIEHHFNGVPFRFHSRLVYDIGLHPYAIDEWMGKRYLCDQWSDGSVIHACTSVAAMLGAPEITFYGVDMCYPGDASHVDGAALPFECSQPWRPKAVNGHGDLVTTGPDLVQYHRSLEIFMDTRPHIRWRKRGRDGVPLLGAEWID